MTTKQALRILIVGGGGREHALAWKIAKSPRCEKLYCTPGNPGIAQLAECIALKVDPGDGYAALIDWCSANAIDLVVAGPERPLADGIADALAGAGIACFGPMKAGAQLEADKTFSKLLMHEAGIPTAASQSFTELDKALAYLDTRTAPYVIKASGLAEGKGVTVAATREDAERALRDCLEASAFGSAGREVLVEDFLVGEEASMLAFTDGKSVKLMDSAQDHKPVFDGDRGPNTGGMGAYSPAPVVTDAVREATLRRVLEPCVAALRARGIDYRGVIYAGLMVAPDGTPNVVEFNCRFGDPETQVLLPRLKNDLVDVMRACIDGTLDNIQLHWDARPALAIVAASGGYPGPYVKGKAIEGLNAAADGSRDEVIVFHAGTTRNAAGQVVTNGGRVLAVTALGSDLAEANARAKAALAHIHFDGMHHRSDIGHRALAPRRA